MAGMIGAGFVALGVIYLAAAAAIVRQRHKSLLLVKSVTAAAFTGIAAICAGLAYFQFEAGLPFNTVYKARSIATLSIPPLLRVCFEMRGRARLGRIVEASMFVFWAVAVAFTVATDWVDVGAASLVPFVDRVGPHEQALRICLTATLAWALVELYRTQRATEGLERRQMSYFFVGIAIYALGAISLSASAVLLGRGQADPAMSLLFSIPWVALTLYSATRYRLFEVGFLFSRTVAGLVVIAAACLLGYAIHHLLAPHAAGPTATVATTGLIALLLLTSSGLRESLLERVAQLFGHRHGRETATSPLMGLSLAELSPRVVEHVDHLVAARPIALYLRRTQGGHALTHGVDLPDDAPAKLEESSALVGWLRGRHEVLILEEQVLFGADDLVKAVRDELGPLDVAAVVPLTTGGRLEGLLAIGPRVDREAFSEADLEGLLALATRAALAVENFRLYAALDDAVNDLDAFVRSAAHDLRSPLRGIDNLAAFARDDLDDAPEAVAEHLDAIRQRARRMESLLDGIERYLRARPNPHATSESVALDSLVRRVVSRHLPEAFEARLDVPATEVRTVVPALETVLEELVDNAHRHHDRPEGVVRIAASVEDGVLDLTVRDDGPGIDQRFQTKIFVLFQTLERRDVTEANGIGLAMCRRIVQHRGGELEVASEGRGATFHLRWPLDTA